MQRRAIFAWFPDGRVERVSPADGIYYQACVHPDGIDAIFFGASSGAPRLWRVTFATGELTPLTDADAGARHPVYSWDGQKIAFASDRLSAGAHERIEQFHASTRKVAGDVTFNIFVADADGSNVQQLTAGAYQDHRPTFSPDGEMIIFASNRDGTIRIWSVPSDGSEPARKLLTEGWGYRPWCSVDGKTIYFYSDIESENAGEDRICQMPAAGGTGRRLPNDDGGITHGAFADPGGECLLVHSTRSGEWGIWELPLNGEPMRQLRPAGYRHISHPTRSPNGVLTFDMPLE